MKRCWIHGELKDTPGRNPHLSDRSFSTPQLHDTSYFTTKQLHFQPPSPTPHFFSSGRYSAFKFLPGKIPVLPFYYEVFLNKNLKKKETSTLIFYKCSLYFSSVLISLLRKSLVNRKRPRWLLAKKKNLPFITTQIGIASVALVPVSIKL